MTRTQGADVPARYSSRLWQRDHGSGIATATRAASTPRIVTPGADQSAMGGVVRRACSSVLKSKKPKPSTPHRIEPVAPGEAPRRSHMREDFFRERSGGRGCSQGSILSLRITSKVLALTGGDS